MDTLLEEARLRCQRLRDHTREGAERVPLKLHCDLGIAGYLASSSVAPDRRGELLAVAHKHAGRSVPDEIRVLIETARRAEQAGEPARDERLACEHMQDAPVHPNRALELPGRDATAGPGQLSRPPATIPRALQANQTQEGER